MKYAMRLDTKEIQVIREYQMGSSHRMGFSILATEEGQLLE
jgi:hypothetical protein